jgi:RNA polymerase sigma factor (sigma-70 family)
MPIYAKAYDWVPEAFPDEALVVMAQLGFHDAAEAMVLRCLDDMKRLIARLARTYRLPRDEISDAEQNGVLNLFKAIEHYDTLEIAKPRGRTFRSFSYQVLLNGFQDYVKHYRRVERHYDRSMKAARALADGTNSPRVGQSQENQTNTDPATAAECHEFVEKWSSVIRQFDRNAREIYEAILSGKKLKELAAEWGKSRATAQRRKGKFLANLATRMKAELGAGKPSGGIGSSG